MKTIKSDRFGHWEMRADGLQQHGKTSKQMRRMLMDMGVPKKLAIQQSREMKNNECWYDATGKYKVVKHDIYPNTNMYEMLVHSDEKFMPMVTWLSVRMNNGKDWLCDWRDFQAIKSDLCSPTREGMEIYPSEERVHDLDNVFHIWVLPEGMVLPIGYARGDVESSTHVTPYQRDLNE